jgi:hypothetical protein
MPIRSCGELAVTSRHDQGAARIAIIRAAVENSDQGVLLFLGVWEIETRRRGKFPVIPCTVAKQFPVHLAKIPCSVA